MPPVTAEDNSSSVIAYLIVIPIAILFAGTAVAITCSEKWNKSDNRIKRFLRRRKSQKKSPKKRASISTIKTEDTAESEVGRSEPTSSQGSENTIAVTEPQVSSRSSDSGAIRTSSAVRIPL
jgi:GRB2-binding adapter (GAPT)